MQAEQMAREMMGVVLRNKSRWGVNEEKKPQGNLILALELTEMYEYRPMSEKKLGFDIWLHDTMKLQKVDCDWIQRW